MVKSIIQSEPDYCFWCGRRDEPLDRHHVFFGNDKKASEKYGLTVYLCHSRCHIFGRGAVHQNREVDLAIKKQVQRRAMKEYDWNFDDWLERFSRNYL